MNRTFLTAEWRNLLMLNYAVDPALLAAWVPRGTELDSYAGKTYLSLIGFNFNRTRVLGFAIPFHQNFEEVNVRFYVRRGKRKGVVFIKELVPRRAIAAVARWAFNEKYQRVPMDHRIDRRPDGTVAGAEFGFLVKGARCVMSIETEGPSFLPPEGSESQFITEHYWGYAAQADGSAKEYEVQHPRWQVWRAAKAGFTGDPTPLYGPQIAAVLAREADSAFLAQGSAVTVFQGDLIPS
jgi:uncharacterized protein YqjF (DUF2071 family)